MLKHLRLTIKHIFVASVILLNRLDAFSGNLLGLFNLVSGAFYTVRGLKVGVTFVSATIFFLLLLGIKFRLDKLILVKESELLT